MGNRHWDMRETEFLKENWNKGKKYILKKIKRTEDAVEIKAQRLKLGGCVESSEYLTARNISDIMNVDSHAVLRWIEKGLLKYRLAPINAKIYQIKLDDLKTFLKDNPELWDSRKLHRNSLWYVEPEWLKKKRLKDNMKPVNEFKNWSPGEDAIAINLFKIGKTHREIAIELGRSTHAVEHRLPKLDIWGSGKLRPEKRGTKK